MKNGTYDVVWADTGTRDDLLGDIKSADDVKGKIALVKGHYDFYGSIQFYARAVAKMTEMGAAAVIIYDPSASADDIKDMALGGPKDGGSDGESWFNTNSVPTVFVTADQGEALKNIDAAKRTVEKSDATKAMPYITSADGTKVTYTEVKNADGTQSAKFSDVADGDYDYVWCGMARTSGDYDGQDYDGDINGDWSKLKGKIALVQGNRWFMFEDNVYSYDQMVANCIDNGAIAVIVFDDRYSEATDVAFSDDGWLNGKAMIPTIQVGYGQGEALRDAADKKITVKQGQVTEGSKPQTKSYYQMSDYSSWGVTPDLKLKPEIAAPGGNVYSSVLNNQYAYYSGTSMATPQMSGISALMHEYVNSDPKFANLSANLKANAVTQLLMSTAVPMVDPRDDTSYYTPRQQGAGVANVPAATKTEVFATVDGAEEVSRPKADLGESSEGTWTFTVTLHNLGSADHSYTPDTAALSDTVADGLFQQQMKNWSGQGIDVSYSGDAYDATANTVKVPAKGIANLTVTVSAQDAFKEFASANTPNGTFVDGFAMLKTAEEGGVDLSVPFVGFYGDWSKAPVFDKTADADYHIYGSKFIKNYGGDLGVNPMAESDDQKHYDAGKVVVSNSGVDSAPVAAQARTGLLRNVDNFYTQVIGPDGSDQGDVSADFVRKSFYHQTAKVYVAAEDNFQAGTFYPGGSEDVQEGAYTFHETATTAGPTPEQQSQDFTIYYDKTAPQIIGVDYSDNNGDPTLTYTVVDNTFVASIDLVAPDEPGITAYSKFYRKLVTDADLTGKDDAGNNVYKVTVKVSDAKAAWGTKYGAEKQIPNTVRAYAWDYGKLLSGESKAVLTPVAATGVTLPSDTLTVAKGQQSPLTATVAPADSTQTDLVWTTSNDKVATVDGNGVVTGVANGEADITVAVKDNPQLTDTVKVKVADVSADAGIVLSNDSLRVVSKGGTAQVSALLAAAEQGKDVTWESSDENVFSVKPADGDSTKAVITGGYQTGDATLTATVDGKKATATIQNRPEDYDDFIIDENHVLTGYRGSKTTIIIPNDVTEIGEKAFFADMQIDHVGIPASVKKIDAQAFAVDYQSTGSSSFSTGRAKQFSFEDTKEHPSQLTEIGEKAFWHGGATGDIVLPSSLTKLGEAAFQSCLSLSSVTLPDSLRTIPDNAFQGALLGIVTMSDNVTSIGNSAFGTCLYLTTVKLTGAPEGSNTILPSKLENLGSGAFSGTYVEGDVVVPATLKHVPDGAFSGDRYITSVTLQDGVESIGYAAFAGMMGLTSFTMPDSVTRLDGRIFQDAENLKEVTVSRNLEPGQLENQFAWNYAMQKVNIPDDAKNYAAKDGVAYTKDMATLVYVPTAKTGTFAIPEGVKNIADSAFESTKLSNVTFPSTLESIAANGFTKQLDVIDLGSNIKSIAKDAFRQKFYDAADSNAGYTPKHLIVRGGQDGSYSDTAKATEQQTAYFGSGMTNLAFTQSGSPATLVVPADLKTLDLSGNKANPTAITVYAPANSDGWGVAEAALKAIGADPAKQLKAYTPLAAKATLGSIPEQGKPVTVAAQAEGGVDGAKSFRFVQVAADGTEKVLSDWSDKAQIDWTVPGNGATVRVEVRDATMLTAESTFGPEAPALSADLDTTPVAVLVGGTAPKLSVNATAEEGANLTYQWFKDGKAIDGATSADYQPAADAEGTSEYYVVATAAKDGLVATTTSKKATVKVVPVASAPKITADLPLSLQVSTGGSLVLSVGAEAPEADSALTYQWFKDGVAIDGATQATYAVPTAEAGEHSYYVVVTNTVDLKDNAAQSRSSVAKVTVKDVVFSDVADPTAWYYDSVMNAARLGYMSGYAGTDLFGPEDTLTRAQAAAVLFNMAGADEADYDGSFADVAAGDWFAGSVAWAKASGVMSGYEGTDLFGSGDSLTREQMAAALYNYAKNVAKQDVSVDDVDGTLAKFGDAGEVSGWAREAVAWAIDRGIMGKGGSIDAQAPITRAEIAAMAVDFQPNARL